MEKKRWQVCSLHCQWNRTCKLHVEKATRNTFVYAFVHWHVDLSRQSIGSVLAAHVSDFKLFIFGHFHAFKFDLTSMSFSQSVDRYFYFLSVSALFALSLNLSFDVTVFADWNFTLLFLGISFAKNVVSFAMRYQILSVFKLQ